MHLVSSVNYALCRPDLTRCAKEFLDTASAGLDKVKNVAAAVLKNYKPVLAFTLMATVAFRSSLVITAAVAAGVALASMYTPAAPGRADTPSLHVAVCPFDGSKGICAVIKAIALTTLKEMAAVIAVSSLAALFVSSQFGIVSLAVGATISVCLNLFLRTLSGAVFLIYAEKDPDSHVRTMPEGTGKKFIDFVEYVAPTSYSFVHFNTLDTVIHESGHALAAKALYSHAEPQIVLFPYGGGVTGFFPKELSWIGKAFGADTSNSLIAAAGPAAAVGVAAAELAMGDHFERTHPRLSRYLKLMGSMNLASHIVYALTAFSEAKSAATASPVSGHDFVRLWAGGIHPYVSVISMVAFPLIVKTGIYLSAYSTSEPAAALNIG